MSNLSSLFSFGSRAAAVAVIAIALLTPVPALQAQAPSKTYYVPVYESDFADAMQVLEDGDFGVVENVETVVSIVATVDGTVVYYDHVEDGYELDIGDPMQPTTQVWNLDSGDVLGLRNSVPGTGPLPGTFPYSGGDRIATSRTVAVTRVGWDAEVGTVIAGAFEVLDTGVWGTEYVAPVGEDVASFSMFEKTFLYVMAKEATNVSVVYPGQPAQNFVLPQGGSLALPDVTLGTRVLADAPVQAHIIGGDTAPEGLLEMRCYTLYPVEAWSDSYFSPVGNSTLNGDLTTIWLYNDGLAPITVDFNTQGVIDDDSVAVGAGAVVPFDMPVALGGEFSSSDGPFYALATVNSPANGEINGVKPDNDTWDWGFTLVPSSQLSPMAIVGWGPGEKDTPLDQNGSPVWVTAPVDTTVYISYDGDLVEEASVPILAFESLKIFDPDNDQTGLRVFTRSEGGQPPVPLAVAWGEDPDTAGPGNPYLDLGTTVLPIRALGLLKEAFLEDDADGDGVTSPGDTLLYELKVINEGTATVHNVVLADEVPAYTTYVPLSTTVDGVPIADDDTGAGAITEFPLDEDGLDLGHLGVGQESVVTFEVVIDDPLSTEVDTIRNIAVAYSDETPPTMVEVEDPVIDPAIHLEKTVFTGAGDESDCPGSEEVISEDGETVTYCFEIRNDGNVALDLSFEDLDLAIDLSDLAPVDDSALAVGETRTYYYQATVNGAWFDLDGDFENTAEVSGGPLDPNGDPIPDAPNPTDDDTANLTQARPELALVKSSTTTSVTAADQVVPYSYDLTNTGNVELTSVTLIDDNTDAVPVCDWAGSSDGVTPAGILSVGEIVTCTAEHTVTQAEIDAGGDLTNIATADSAETEEVTDQLDIPIVQDPDLSVEKSSATEAVTEAGQVVPYSYLVTNTGNMTLTNLTISDNNVDATPTCDWAGSSDEATDPGTLSPGETVICSAEHTVSQAEMDAGGFLSNVVTVDSDETEPEMDDLDIPITQNPVLALVKSSPVTEVSALGAVPYNYLLTNMGNVTLTNVTLLDDKTDATPVCDWGTSSDAATGEGTLSPSETVNCSGVHTVTQGELDLGDPLVNIATADSDETEPVTDTVTIPIVRMPVLLVLKTSLTTEVTFAGQVVDYSYKVTNDGNVTLTNITVTDNNVDQPPGVDCAGVTMLAPGAMTICTAQRTVTQAEIDAGGDLTNIVTADSAETDPVDDDLDIPIVKAPGIAFDKYVVYTGDLDESGGFTPGDTVTYFGYEVSNPSEVDNLDPSTVPDPGSGIYLLAPAKSCDQALLLPGETTFCVATYVLSEGDLPLPSSMIDADSNGEVSVGDTLTYQFAVLNTGNVTLTELEVQDPNAPPSCGVTELAPAASTICEATYVVTQDDADAGSIPNTAVATTEETPPVDDTEVLPVPQNPALTLVKSADVETYSAVGDVITYGYVVTNAGNVTLNNVTLSDPLAGLGAITCSPEQPSVLAPTEQMTCEATYTIGQADLDAGSVVNVATADSDETDPVDDSVTVTANQNPLLTLEKTSDVSTYDAVGDVITYGYVVSNGGNVTLTNVTLADPLAGLSAVTCAPEQPSILAPGESMTCSATYTIGQTDLNTGSVVNIATADSDETGPVDDTVTVTANQSPALTLVKTATPSTYSAVDEVIGYSYLVTNSGNVSLAGPVTVADDKASATCPDVATVGNLDGVLDPGESVTCSATYTITQGDLNAGSVTNTATASADGTDSNPDDETVTANQAPALTLVKTATPSTYSAVDEVIGYSYLVTNSGNVTISQPITIDDDKSTDEACPATPASLAPGESITCTASYTITQSDLDAGSVTNVATATGKDPVGQDVTSNPDDETVTADAAPALTLVKTAVPQTYSAVGQVIGYSYEVSNSGNVTILGPISVTDDNVDAVAVCAAGDLAPLASITCTAQRTVAQADLVAGSIVNVAFATGTSPAGGPVVSNEDTETVTATVAEIRVIKVLSPMTDPGVFDLLVNGAVIRQDASNNDEGTAFVPAGLVQVAELAGTDTSLDGYSTTLACTDNTGATLVDETFSSDVSDRSATFEALAGQSVTCTFSNFEAPAQTDTITVTKTVAGAVPVDVAFTFEVRTGAVGQTVDTTAAAGTVLGSSVLQAPDYRATFLVAISPDYQLCEVNGNYEWLAFDQVAGAFNPGVDNEGGGVDYGTVCIDIDPQSGDTEINVDNGLRTDPRTIGYWSNHCEPNGNGNDDLTKSFIRDLVAGLSGRSGFSFVDPASGRMNMGLGFVLGSDWTPDGLRTLETRGKPGGGGPPPAAVEYFQLWNLLPDPTVGPTALDCDTLTRILNKRDLDGRKFAEDPAYKIASQLFAAELNQLNDAVRCQGVLNAIDDARDLLQTIGFTGYGGFSEAIEDREWTQQAIDLAETLDQYNNSDYEAACDYESFDYSVDPLEP